jgi:hypothetical protein
MYWFSEKGKGGEVRLKAGVGSGLFCSLWIGTKVHDAAENRSGMIRVNHFLSLCVGILGREGRRKPY